MQVHLYVWWCLLVQMDAHVLGVLGLKTFFFLFDVWLLKIIVLNISLSRRRLTG